MTKEDLLYHIGNFLIKLSNYVYYVIGLIIIIISGIIYFVVSK